MAETDAKEPRVLDDAAASERRLASIRALPCWGGPVEPQPLTGGITNRSYLVADGGRRYVVRLGDDLPLHHILRWNERAASEAAHAAGLSPRIVHHGPGVLVIDFIEGKTLAIEDVRDRSRLARIVPVVRRCHRELARHLRGPALIFWVFHVLRDYAATLRERGSRLTAELPRLLEQAAALEAAVGPVDIAYCHNDLLPGNLIDDGARIWLIDWDYAGYGSPLFDLAGLAANCRFEPADERFLLEAYFERPVTDELWRRFAAWKCASYLRESLWSLVSELTSELPVDFVAYTSDNLARFAEARRAFQEL